MSNQAEGLYTIQVDNKSVRLEASSLDAIDIRQLSDRVYHIIDQDFSVKAEVQHVNLDTKQVTLKHNNRVYTINIATELDQLVASIQKASAKKNQDLTIKSSMPGLVIDVLVEEGQEIKEGDPVMIIEAMKMENVIKSKFDGRISKLHCEKGDAIDKNQLLLECRRMARKSQA